MANTITVDDYRFWLLLCGTVVVFSLIRLLPRLIGARGRHISAVELKRRLDHKDSMLLLDVRSAREYFGPDGHIAGSRSLPLNQLDQTAVRRLAPDAESGRVTVVIVCNSGVRAAMAAHRLRNAGVNVMILRGGLEGWRSDYLPLIQGRTRDA